jgi:hypothetical protein
MGLVIDAAVGARSRPVYIRAGFSGLSGNWVDRIARQRTGKAAKTQFSADTERWQVAAGAITAYRSRWNIPEQGTIDKEPTNPEQRPHWDRQPWHQPGARAQVAHWDRKPTSRGSLRSGNVCRP